MLTKAATTVPLLLLVACSEAPPSSWEPALRARGKIPTAEVAAWQSFTATSG